MNRTLRLTSLALLCSGHLAATTVQALELAPQGEELRHADVIRELESREGAYGATLPESLLSLGLLLQQRGRHKDAMHLFKRGVHLVRINQGLNSSAQIPLLRGQIQSHIAAGDYALADERQEYLYRVQTHNFQAGKELTAAYLQHARWQLDAFVLQLDKRGHVRLMNTSEYYSRARDEVSTREGPTSPNLYEPLIGLLRTQYLIQGYVIDSSELSSSSAPNLSQERYRYARYRLDTDDVARDSIARLGRLKRGTMNPQVRQLAASIMLSDWLLWTGARQEAMAGYRATLEELSALPAAQTLVAELELEPTPLPDLGELHGLPETVDEGGEDVVELSFDVTDSGRVINLERLDSNDALNGKANRLMRLLRRTPFRPRFEGAQPVPTTNLARNFRIEK
ncbi:MAG: hypothetical protein HKN19_06190 [Halioglobus sp.]|nr:hypothetical protein [Halioglobus sp.]